MLTPHMYLPAEFKTTEGKPAVVVGYYNGRYHGFVAVNDSPGEDYRLPNTWNASGVSLHHDGDVSYYSEDCNLQDPFVQRLNDARDAFNALTSDVRDALTIIREATVTRKIPGIRMMRAITGAGLVEAKLWHETVIPEAAAA